MKPPSWKPIRRGPLFCAPACGRGCTIAEHAEAHRRGLALAKRLGTKWAVFVHENMGWHCGVRSPCGRIEVRGEGNDFSAYLGSGRFCSHGKTPKAAVRRVVQQGRAALTELSSLLFELTL